MLPIVRGYYLLLALLIFAAVFSGVVMIAVNAVSGCSLTLSAGAIGRPPTQITPIEGAVCHQYVDLLPIILGSLATFVLLLSVVRFNSPDRISRLLVVAGAVLALLVGMTATLTIWNVYNFYQMPPSISDLLLASGSLLGGVLGIVVVLLKQVGHAVDS